MGNDLKRVDTAENRSRLMICISRHIGRGNAIGMGKLYEDVFGENWKNLANDTRKLRRLVSVMQAEGVAICASTNSNGGGYYLPIGTEKDDFLKRLERRALKILARISKIKKVTLADYMGQMKLGLEGGHGKEAYR